MIEITTAVVEKVQTLMHDNAGFIMAKNVERILDDLARQAEIFGATKTSIPVTMKMTVEVDDCGVHLTFDSVTWQKTLRATDKACYTVDYDPRQPNLPGFDDQQEKPPVIDVKALPEHKDESEPKLMDIMDRECFAKLKKANIEALRRLTEAAQKNVYAYRSEVTVWMIERGGDPTWLQVPNSHDMLETMDADNDTMIVADLQGFSESSLERIDGMGWGTMRIFRKKDGEWQIHQWYPHISDEDPDPWKIIRRVQKQETSQMVEYLCSILEDDCVVLGTAELYYDLID